MEMWAVWWNEGPSSGTWVYEEEGPERFKPTAVCFGGVRFTSVLQLLPSNWDKEENREKSLNEEMEIIQKQKQEKGEKKKF